MFRSLTLFVLLSISIISCQKEISTELNGGTPGNSGNTGNNGSNSGGVLSGTWKLDYMTMQAAVRSTTVGPGIDMSVITNMGYRTKQNTGTMSFNSGKAKSNELGYAVDTTMIVYTYESGSLIDSTEMPFVAPYMSSSATADYKLVGTDSITFTGGGIITMNNGSTTSSAATGMKYTISGNKLTMSYQFARDSTIQQSGMQAVMHQQGKGALYFTKQ